MSCSSAKLEFLQRTLFQLCGHTVLAGLKYEEIYFDSSKIYSRLSRYSTARGSGSRLSLGGPTKVMALKSFLITESSLKFEIKEHLIDFVVMLH